MATREEIQAILTPFINAVLLVLGNEKFAATNPAEPVLTSDLFHHMYDLYEGLEVNHLWDRRENLRKRLSHIKDGELKEALIIPDIIVHRANTQDDNLLVVEAKRHPATDDGDDVWKLEGMTAEGPYHYKLGVHITLNVPAHTVTECVAYSEGFVDTEATKWLRERLP